MNRPTPPSPGKYLLRDMGPAAREFYRRLAEEGELATTWCEPCGRASFPPRPRCLRCRAAQEWRELPRRGTLHAFTTQERALRFGAPAVLALAEVEGILLPGIAEAPFEELRIAQEIAVELRPEPETGLTLLAFVPAGGSH